MGVKTVSFAAHIAQVIREPSKPQSKRPPLVHAFRPSTAGNFEPAPWIADAVNVSPEGALDETDVSEADIPLAKPASPAVSTLVAQADKPVHFDSFGIRSEKLDEQGDSSLQFKRYRAKTAQRRDEKLAKRSFTGKMVYKKRLLTATILCWKGARRG
jgi:hypothetical protein